MVLKPSVKPTSSEAYTGMRKEILQQFRKDIEQLEKIENPIRIHSNLIYDSKPFFTRRTL